MASSPGPRRSSPSRSRQRLGPRLIAGHRASEPGHAVVLDHLGLDPILDLDLRLGEASGAALAMGVIVAAVAIRDEMATFDSAGYRTGRVVTDGIVSSGTPPRPGPACATAAGAIRRCRRDGVHAAEGLAIRLAPLLPGGRPDRHEPQPSSARDGHDPGHAGGAGRPRGGPAMAGGGRRRMRRTDLRRGRGQRRRAVAARLAAGEADIDWPGGETASALLARVTAAWEAILDTGQPTGRRRRMRVPSASRSRSRPASESPRSHSRSGGVADGRGRDRPAGDGPRPRRLA